MKILMTIIDPIRSKVEVYYGDVSTDRAEFLSGYDDKTLRGKELSPEHRYPESIHWENCLQGWPKQWEGMTLQKDAMKLINLPYDRLVTFFYDY